MTQEEKVRAAVAVADELIPMNRELPEIGGRRWREVFNAMLYEPYQAATATQLQGGVWNVKDFGATGDGETDDTAAIRQAMAVASGGRLVFPAGRYRIEECALYGIQGVFGDTQSE